MSCNVPSFITAPPLRLSTSPCHSRSPAVYSVRMAIPNLKISRRELGTLVLGASAVALSATFGHADEALAESAKKPPAFVTDESGVKYFDVKEGTGARPIEGDFVVIDYVSNAFFIFLRLKKDFCSQFLFSNLMHFFSSSYIHIAMWTVGVSVKWEDLR